MRRVASTVFPSVRSTRVLAGGLLATSLVLSLALAGCAARGGFTLPTGPGEPAPEFAPRFDEATRACRAIKTMTAEAAMSGRVAGRRLRGRLQMGLGDPNAMRIEAVAPFGQPIFVLAARDGEGTLLLPRDHAVLRGAPASAIVDALAGIPLSPTELRAVLTGCVSPSSSATGGRQYGDGSIAVTLADASVAYLRIVDGATRVVAAQRPGLMIEYSDYENGLPRRAQLRRMNTPAAAGDAANAGTPAPGPRVEANVTLTLSQIELDVPLGPEAFEVDVPKEARPITLDELRQSGPLGDRR